MKEREKQREMELLQRERHRDGEIDSARKKASGIKHN
jgi:hypothetical protein